MFQDALFAKPKKTKTRAERVPMPASQLFTADQICEAADAAEAAKEKKRVDREAAKTECEAKKLEREQERKRKREESEEQREAKRRRLAEEENQRKKEFDRILLTCMGCRDEWDEEASMEWLSCETCEQFNTCMRPKCARIMRLHEKKCGGRKTEGQVVAAFKRRKSTKDSTK